MQADEDNSRSDAAEDVIVGTKAKGRQKKVLSHEEMQAKQLKAMAQLEEDRAKISTAIATTPLVGMNFPLAEDENDAMLNEWDILRHKHPTGSGVSFVLHMLTKQRDWQTPPILLKSAAFIVRTTVGWTMPFARFRGVANAEDSPYFDDLPVGPAKLENVHQGGHAVPYDFSQRPVYPADIRTGLTPVKADEMMRARRLTKDVLFAYDDAEYRAYVEERNGELEDVGLDDSDEDDGSDTDSSDGEYDSDEAF